MRALKKVEGINVVPLIDIMLVLLAIILTVSSFIALGKLEISLPQASSHTTIEPKFFEIGIDANKQFFINQKQVLKEALVAELKTLTKSDSVAISADKMATYEDFIFIIDLLKQKEIEKISMVVTKHE